MELRTEEWKEFKIGDLFDSENGDTDIKREDVNNSGYPVITSGTENFGILGSSDIDAKLIDKNTITIDMFGNVYFRNFKYKMVTHARVFALIPKKAISQKSLLFIATTLFYLKEKFGYSHMCSFNKIKKKHILLPEKDGEPDWSFMEEYISFIENRYIDKIDEDNKEKIKLAMKVTGITEEQLDGELVVEEPKRVEEFRVGDLFEFGHGERLTVADREPGNIPFITAGAEKRGIKEHISNHRKLYKNPITIDMFGNTFYHNLEMDGDDNIYFLMGENISENTKLYIATTLNKKLSNRYSYSEQFRQKQLNSLIVVLPAIDKSTPDFEYMEKAIYIYTKAKIKDWKLAGEEKVRILREIISVWYVIIETQVKPDIYYWAF